MAYSRTYFTVKTNGQALVVSATAPGGGSSALHLTSAVSSAVTQPYTITSDTSFYVLDELAGDYIVSCKQADGSELFGKAVKLQPGDPKVVEPGPSALQLAAEAGRAIGTFLPSGAIAHTFPRYLAITSYAGLVSGRLTLVGIDLQVGSVVTSASFLSGTQALVAGTAQWFALYDANLALLAQTADDTSTAWAAHSFKTLTFATPYTVTKSGFHYLGIMVAGGTVPNLSVSNAGAVLYSLPPILSGYSTTGLTTTAPATAAALTANLPPYAYVS